MVNPCLDVDKKILSEIYSSSEPMDNLEVLCDVYGSRWPGSPDDLASVKYMVEKLQEYGLENAHYDSFEIPGWERGPATLEVTSPIKRELEVISLPHTLAGEVETDLVYLGAGPAEAYEARREEIDGNVVMVDSSRPRGSKRLVSRTGKYMRSVLAGAKAWVFMNHYPTYGPVTGGVYPIIPSVGIGYEDGAFLARLLKREGRVSVRIKTEGRNLPVETHNVICDVPGTSDDGEYVMTGCHIDGHDITQGALDPVSGLVVVMEIARVLNTVKGDLKRRVRCAGFGAEEIGLHGSYAYTAMHEDELGDCRFMLNLDGGGRPLRRGVLFNGYPELEPLVERWAVEMKTDMPTGQTINAASDHWPFFLKGVPSGNGGDPDAFPSKGGRGVSHTRYDTVDKVELKYLRFAAANYSRFLLRVANVDPWPVKRKSREEIDGYIKRMGLEETAALVNRVKDYVRTWDEIHPDTEDWLKRKVGW